MLPTIHLRPPLISDYHIKEKIICIRAHRERIFRIATEITNNKLLCHNYGHGGAGWTFLFGAVNESIQQFEQQIRGNAHFTNQPICIIGAGCYGLLTAVLLTYKGYEVTIIAKETENIPSYKAAGFFFPRPRKSSTQEERAVFESVGIESYRIYQKIITKTHPFITKGVYLLPAYYGLDIDPGFAPYQMRALLSKPQTVCIDFGNGKNYTVNEYKTLFINAYELIEELHRVIKELKIPLIKQEITDFNQIPAAIIFNCSGLGSQQLTHDARIVPVQGHLIMLKNQPDISQLQYMINYKTTMHNTQNMPRDELIYFAPKESGILGITFLRGQDSLTANHHEFDRLIDRCRQFFGT